MTANEAGGCVALGIGASASAIASGAFFDAGQFGVAFSFFAIAVGLVTAIIAIWIYSK